MRVTQGLLAGGTQPQREEVRKCHHMISLRRGMTLAHRLTVIVSLATPTMTSRGGRGEEMSEEGAVFHPTCNYNPAVLLPAFFLGFALGGYS